MAESVLNDVYIGNLLRCARIKSNMEVEDCAVILKYH